MAQQQMELPPNYKHTDLKARSFTPSLDLGVHNVQGINVWANTAPRGWSTSYQRTKATPPKADPPTVSVCPATPSLDTEIIQQRMQETKIAEQEEQMRMQQEQQIQMQMQMQQEEEMRMQMEQQEQIRVQEENMRLQQQQEEMRRQQEEQMRIQQQQEEQRRIQRQQEEQMRIQQQQEEQMRIQRQQEEQMIIQQQQEEQRRIQMQQEEEARAAAEMRRQQEEAERQRQEQMQRQQQEEQMRIQQQQEEQRRIQIQQQEAAERQRQEQIQRQEMERQQQMMMQQQSMSQMSSSSSTTKSGGIEVESRPEPLLSESQLAQPPMSSSSLFESSQSQSFAQQSSSIQQSSSSYSQSQKEIYESQEFSGGVMKGYKKKEEFASEQTGETSVRDPGVFGGIQGDRNSLVDAEFDYKKHRVKDLAKHFALAKPKADIPHTILPEQRMYNGDHGPSLNYLTASKNEMGSSSSTQSFMKKEISQEDFEASKQAYEMKKIQQQQAMESQQSQSNSSTVVTKSESSTKSEQTKAVVNERRQSLRDGLLMDPAKAHAEAGLIDPSSILRGETSTHWKHTDPSPPKTSLRATSSSPSSKMYISRSTGPKAFAPVKFNTLPRSSQAQASLPPIPSKSLPHEQISHQLQSQSYVSNTKTSIDTLPQPQSQTSFAPPSPNSMQQRNILPPSSPSLMQQKHLLPSASPNLTLNKPLDSPLPH